MKKVIIFVLSVLCAFALVGCTGQKDNEINETIEGNMKTYYKMEDGTWKQFDMVPGEYETRQGQPDYTGRICVIGTNLNEEELKKVFHI